MLIYLAVATVIIGCAGFAFLPQIMEAGERYFDRRKRRGKTRSRK